jgi:ribosome biogenesis protein ERB1
MAVSKKTKQSAKKNQTVEVAEMEADELVNIEAIDEGELDDVSTDNYTSSDDSDDEIVLNRSGSVPGHWYETEDHRGYDVFGKKVVKTLMSSKIDELLKNAENPDQWRTVQDLQNEREVYLTDADIEIIRRLRAGQYPDGSVGDEGYFVEFDDEPHKLHPVRHRDLPKSRFLPSKDETKEITRLVKLIRAGKLVPGRRNRNRSQQPVLCDLWAQEEENGRIRGPASLPAPKMALPGHAESYRPPTEYLFTDEEKQEWIEGDDSTRKSTFIPETFGSLRRVPWYGAFITERFARCLDLYTVPRMLKKKMNVDPESLIPKLPQISDLRPFPSSLAVEYIGHESGIVGVSATKDWLVSASSDSVRVWDIMTGKCVACIEGEFAASAVAWHPTLPIVTVGDEDGHVHFVSVRKLIVDPEMEKSVIELLEIPSGDDSIKNWTKRSVGETDVLTFKSGCVTAISSLSWHQRGNFVAAVSSQSPSRETSCCVISIQTKKHVSPLKGKGQVIGGAKHVIFHPSKPYLVVAGSSNVGIFDLKSQTRVNMLSAPSNTLSSVAVHPAGEGVHVVVTSLDSKVIWFDSEVRNKPWKTFRHHTSAVRKGSFHPLAASTLPLMASAGDDNAAHVLYSKVYADDSTKNPLVVPVKKLNHPAPVKDCHWHPSLPWLFTACQDGVVRLWA